MPHIIRHEVMLKATTNTYPVPRTTMQCIFFNTVVIMYNFMLPVYREQRRNEIM